MRTCFVTGTGTGVGKTYVTAAVLRAARRRGLYVHGIKAVETGLNGAAQGADTLALAAAGAHAPLCFASFSAPAAPSVAARLEGHEVELAGLLDWIRQVAKGDLVLVEGAGGLLVPLNPKASFADVAAELGWRVLVVAADILGTINHSLLTVEALRSRGLEVAAVVLSEPTPGSGLGLENAEEIRRLGQVRTVTLAHQSELADPDLECLWSALA